MIINNDFANRSLLFLKEKLTCINTIQGLELNNIKSLSNALFKGSESKKKMPFNTAKWP